MNASAFVCGRASILKSLYVGNMTLICVFACNRDAPNSKFTRHPASTDGGRSVYFEFECESISCGTTDALARAEHST